jgi:hypothetical protein
MRVSTRATPLRARGRSRAAVSRVISARAKRAGRRGAASRRTTPAPSAPTRVLKTLTLVSPSIEGQASSARPPRIAPPARSAARPRSDTPQDLRRTRARRRATAKRSFAVRTRSAAARNACSLHATDSALARAASRTLPTGARSSADGRAKLSTSRERARV